MDKFQGGNDLMMPDATLNWVALLYSFSLNHSKQCIIKILEICIYKIYRT